MPQRQSYNVEAQSQAFGANQSARRQGGVAPDDDVLNRDAAQQIGREIADFDTLAQLFFELRNIFGARRAFDLARNIQLLPEQRAHSQPGDDQHSHGARAAHRANTERRAQSLLATRNQTVERAQTPSAQTRVTRARVTCARAPRRSA